MKRMNLVFWCLQCVHIGICFWLDDDDGHHRTLNAKRIKLNEISMRRLCVVYAKQHGVIERDRERWLRLYFFIVIIRLRLRSQLRSFVWHFRRVWGCVYERLLPDYRLSSFHKLIGDWFVHLKIERKEKKKKMKIDISELVWVCVVSRLQRWKSCILRKARLND